MMKMHYNVPITSGEVVVGKDFLNYQEVLDDFCNAKYVRILTYNISKNGYRNELMDALKSLTPDVDVKIISNIPSRMPSYYNCAAGESMKKRYRQNFTAYLERLNPENFKSNPEVSFNFSNHAKIIATDNILYIGSANYSDESQDNIESGTLIRDKSAIKRIFDEVFPAIMDESTPYFEDDFNIFRLFVISMEGKFKKWLTWFDNELTWKNAAGIRGLYEYFKFDVDDLECIHMDIEELLELRNLIENTYSETDEEYNGLVDKITEVMKRIDIEWMSDFTLTDSDFYNFVVYDSDTRTDELIQENPDAYDENLDTCVEEAMNKAREEYLDMKSDLEEDIFYLRDQIELVVAFLGRVHQRTLEYSNKWIVQKVDNT